MRVRKLHVACIFIHIKHEVSMNRLSRLSGFIAAAIACGIPLTAAAERPLVKVMNAKEIDVACTAALNRAADAVKAMQKKSGDNGMLREWNSLQIDLENTANPLGLLANVHTDKGARDAADACGLKLTTFATDLFQNEKLFKRIEAVKPKDAYETKLKKDLVEAFEDTGVTLSPEKRARAKAIFEKLEELRQAFDRNVRDDKTRVTMMAEEMKGLPDAYMKDRKPNDKGAYSLTLEYPDYNPFMQSAVSESAREKYMRAFLSRGGKPNLDVLDEIMALRRELAGLYGLKSYADYSIRRKMAESGGNVMKFLDEVKAVVKEAEKKEIAELTAFKAKLTSKPVAETKINKWDTAFYQEAYKKQRFNIDQESLRKYFPTEASLKFTMQVSETLYGVKFKEVKVPTWHNDVRYFDVMDAKTGKFISGFYLDLFPREGKYNHAAAFPLRGVSAIANRTPLSALVTNFNRVGLNHDELETLLHEFGHILHGVLSKTRYNSHAGTNTLVDFVEAPSQMFEEWARREQSLKIFQSVCKECPQLDGDMVKRLDEARRYGQGIRYARQHLFAEFDMMLVGEKSEKAIDVWKGLEGATPLGHVEGTIFPASFAHIAGGYAAGYYGYMWSEVMALDMLSAFGNNLLDPKVGARYRNTILANGGQVPPKELVKSFLGREPNSKAFFDELRGARM
jgi:thimet oligopeptidase